MPLNCFTQSALPKSKFYMQGPELRTELLQRLDEQTLEDVSIHDYQIEAVEATRQMLSLDSPIAPPQPALIVAPTGCGKSGMIVLLPYFLQSNKVLIITPSEIISDQLAQAFWSKPPKKNSFFEYTKMCENEEGLQSFYENVSVIKRSKEPVEGSSSFGNLVICNAQKFGGNSGASLIHRDKEVVQNVEAFFRQFDTLIVDEAHHYPAPTWTRIVEECQKPSNRKGVSKKIIFLTATPKRATRRGSQYYIIPTNRVAYTITKERCYGVSLRRERFVELPLTTRNQIDERYTKDIIELLEGLKEEEPRFLHQAMVLVQGQQNRRDVVARLNADSEDDNYAVELKSSTSPEMKAFTDGNHRVGVTCRVGIEGYDNTRVSLCVVLKKITTGTLMLSQFVGRCVRLRRGLADIDGETISDQTKGVILTYKFFGIGKLYDEMDEGTNEDPQDYEEDEE